MLMDGYLAVLGPFQQYFSHIRMIEVDNERLCVMEPSLRLRRFFFERDLNSEPLDQQTST